jgi:hypothetical protein
MPLQRPSAYFSILMYADESSWIPRTPNDACSFAIAYPGQKVLFNGPEDKVAVCERCYKKILQCPEWND